MENVINILGIVNTLLSVLFGLSFAYQFVYAFLAVFRKPVSFPETDKKHRYAVVVSARNEENVIVNLIKSIKSQTYPSEFVDIYVIADNCTDATAKLARDAGAYVYERFDMERVGKGYALEFFYNQIKEKCGIRYYDAYITLDADNLLDREYITEMNKAYDAGHKIITSYRNSKNFEDNWISAGYSMWFMREAKFMNNPRMMLNTSCSVSGTGYLTDSSIIEENGGWNCFLLTEDFEFTCDRILKGDKIAYCDSAIFYDEQPTKFKQSWTQRTRWTKGFLQVYQKSGRGLMRGMFTAKGSKFACYDMAMNIIPSIIIMLIEVAVWSAILCLTLISTPAAIGWKLFSIALSILGAYFMFVGMALLTTIVEWKRIHASTFHKLIYLLTFPVYMVTYVPIVVAMVFRKDVGWKPIQHSAVLTIDDIDEQCADRADKDEDKETK